MQLLYSAFCTRYFSSDDELSSTIVKMKLGLSGGWALEISVFFFEYCKDRVFWTYHRAKMILWICRQIREIFFQTTINTIVVWKNRGPGRLSTELQSAHGVMAPRMILLIGHSCAAREPIWGRYWQNTLELMCVIISGCVTAVMYPKQDILNIQVIFWLASHFLPRGWFCTQSHCLIRRQ